MRASAANFYISRFYHLAASNGLDADGLLYSVGIDRALIDVPERRIDAEKLAAFITAICDRLQDESMSLSTSPIPRGCFYMMGKLTVHEQNLGKALAQMQRFLGMVTRSFELQLDDTGDRARLSFQLLNPELDKDHLFAELNLLMLHRYSSWLIAENIPLIEVEFSYPPPLQVKEYAFLFPGRHSFNAAANGFTFSKHYLDREVVQNIGTMKSFMHRCPMELFSQPKTDFSLRNEVYNLMFKHGLDDMPSLEEAAGTLLLTKRTLMRRLKDEGTSFQEIKDQIRCDRAIYYLTSNTASVSEIATKIGFTDASVFTRAFKSWTGISPRKFRAGILKQ